MAAKTILHGDAARQALLRGVDLMADAVGRTLGPSGRHVVLQRYDAPPLVTNDGVTIARAIDVFQDPQANQGVQLLRQAATTTEDLIGDGTTTSMILGRAIIRAALHRVSQGAEPNGVRRGIDGAIADAARWILAQARPVTGSSEVAAVATVSSRDPRIGALVAEALERVGHDGVVQVEDSRRFGISLDFRDGMRFDSGLFSRELLTDAERGETSFEAPFVLVANERIAHARQLLGVLQTIAHERTPIVIIADEVSGDALALLALNVASRKLPAVAVKAPAFGRDRTDALEDIAALTGAELVGPDVGRAVASATLRQLGRADRVVASMTETTVMGGRGDPACIRARLREIEAELTYLGSEYEREKRRLRAARLGGSAAMMRVGLDTQAEQEETRHRIRDAIQAGRCALRSGVVPGGGATMLCAAAAIGEGGGDPDESTGRQVVRTALQAPLRQLAANAGLDPSAVVSTVSEAPVGQGVDIRTGELVDLLGAGIFDPAQVVASTLEIAGSIATSCLLTEAVVLGPASRPVRSRGGHGHHHGEDGHGHDHHGSGYGHGHRDGGHDRDQDAETTVFAQSATR